MPSVTLELAREGTAPGVDHAYPTAHDLGKALHGAPAARGKSAESLVVALASELVEACQ
jgi:hypothetical protein